VVGQADADITTVTSLPPTAHALHPTLNGRTAGASGSLPFCRCAVLPCLPYASTDTVRLTVTPHTVPFNVAEPLEPVVPKLKS